MEKNTVFALYTSCRVKFLIAGDVCTNYKTFGIPWITVLCPKIPKKADFWAKKGHFAPKMAKIPLLRSYMKVGMSFLILDNSRRCLNQLQIIWNTVNYHFVLKNPWKCPKWPFLPQNDKNPTFEVLWECWDVFSDTDHALCLDFIIAFNLWCFSM